MQPNPPNDALTIALQALAAALEDQRLADRFLSLSGLDAPELRRRAGEPRVLAAFLRFLEAHEPDLIAVSEKIGARPEQIVVVRRELER